MLVRAFNDSGNDGTGDLRGLADKLDYLEWLGIDCLWLPPFYASPLRDGGYDISDFRAVLPEFGSVEDFDSLIDPSHRICALRVFLKEDSTRFANELIARVGLTHAADRKVRGYSGGMKRRLDLAMALVHSPSVLFLDEPTTGLDIQSRTALWDEVARLAREDEVTVFLTTQYLEEADVLADRVGIIDHGHIVAEGTTDELKAQVGRPTVEAVPADPEEAARLAELLARFGDPCGSTKGVAVRLETGDTGLADVVRALDDAGIEVANLWLHQPTLDDVFLAKTGRSLEGSDEDEDEAEPPQRALAAEPA